jgi:hypothetical protein
VLAGGLQPLGDVVTTLTLELTELSLQTPVGVEGEARGRLLTGLAIGAVAEFLGQLHRS